MRYRVRIRLLGRDVRPGWAPGRPVNKDDPRGTYVGVSSWVQRWCIELTPWVKGINCWSERLR